MKQIKAVIDFFYTIYKTGVSCLFGGCGCMTLFFFAFIFIASYWDQPITPSALKNDTMLVLDISTQIMEGESVTDIVLTNFQETKSIGTLDLSKKILSASKNDKIKGIVLISSSQYNQNSLAGLARLRDLLKEFKAAKKPVYAYLENPSFLDYYTASVADKIYLNPLSEIEFKGLALNSVFFGDALKKYGIDMEFIRCGKYKSAGEIFTSNKMSDESKEVYASLANNLWNALLAEISEQRKIELKTLKEIADASPIVGALEAKELKLADAIAYKTDFINEITQSEKKSLDHTSLLNYSDTFTYYGGNSIAVLYMNGEIIDGKKHINSKITSDYFVSLIEDLRKNESVKAVVIRVNSPGGGVYASEQIRHQIAQLRAEKPVVMSFGGMAASGGYWISLVSDKIYSERFTLTGSIGVFGLAPSVQKLAGDFGITFDGVETSKMASIGTLTRPMTDAEKKIVQAKVDKIYAIFLELVSKGRKIELDEAKKLAEGRVWLASEKGAEKLFDDIGTLEDAIVYAANKAEIAGDYYISEFPKARTFADDLEDFWEGDTGVKAIKMLLPHALSDSLEQAENPALIRTQMPYILDIK